MEYAWTSWVCLNSRRYTQKHHLIDWVLTTNGQAKPAAMISHHKNARTYWPDTEFLGPVVARLSAWWHDLTPQIPVELAAILVYLWENTQDFPDQKNIWTKIDWRSMLRTQHCAVQGNRRSNSISSSIVMPDQNSHCHGGILTLTSFKLAVDHSNPEVSFDLILDANTIKSGKTSIYRAQDSKHFKFLRGFHLENSKITNSYYLDDPASLPKILRKYRSFLQKQRQLTNPHKRFGFLTRWFKTKPLPILWRESNRN